MNRRQLISLLGAGLLALGLTPSPAGAQPDPLPS
jgi:hypothetical protein